MRVLSLCHGMGLLDRAFQDVGFVVVPGCEIDQDMRDMYWRLCGGRALVHDLAELPKVVNDLKFDGIIGGPPCQAHSKMKSFRKPKYPDLTSGINEILRVVKWKWFLFENTKPIEIQEAKTCRLNAMHFYQPHQSRSRWFTHSENIVPPTPIYSGTVDSLMAYPVVMGRVYGPKRGSKLQGYPSVSEFSFPCVTLQKGLANAVPYPLALAWAEVIKKSF